MKLQQSSTKFPDGWTVLPVEECLTIIDYRGKTPNKKTFGIPLITAKIVKDGRILTPEEFIDPNDYDAWMSRGYPQEFDVLMTTEAPLGEIAALDKRKVALAQRLLTLRANPELIDQRFLKYIMLSPFVQEQLHARSTGTTVLGIRQSEFRRVLLAFPSLLTEQRLVVSLLGSLDEKIELNRRTNETLEAFARALFKDWFMDFGPVIRKAQGLSSSELTEEIANLFPEKLNGDNAPEGWRYEPLNAVIEFNPSERLSKDQEAPYLEMSALSTTGCSSERPVLRPFSAGTKFRNGDTLLARITPCLENGKTAFIQDLSPDEVAWGSTEFIVIRPKNNIPSEYGYLLSRQPDFRQHAIRSMTGTSGRQRVQTDSLNRFLVAVPPNPRVWTAFGEIVRPWFELIKTNGQEIETLSKLRDLLMPKLMTGELQLKETQAEDGL